MTPDRRTQHYSTTLVVCYQWVDWYLTQHAVQLGKAIEISPIASVLMGESSQETFAAFKLFIAPIIIFMVGKYLGTRVQIVGKDYELFVHRLVNLIFVFVVINNLTYL